MARERTWDGSTRPNRRTAGTGFRRCVLTTGFGVVTLMAGAVVGATDGWFRAGSERESRPGGEAGNRPAASRGAIDPDDPAGAGRYAGRVLGPDGRTWPGLACTSSTLGPYLTGHSRSSAPSPTPLAGSSSPRPT